MIPQIMLENIRVLAKEAQGYLMTNPIEMKDIQWASRCMSHILMQLESYENAVGLQKRQKTCDHQWVQNQDKNKFCSLCGISAQSVACVGGWL